jgi:hypothetical protein
MVIPRSVSDEGSRDGENLAPSRDPSVGEPPSG